MKNGEDIEWELQGSFFHFEDPLDYWILFKCIEQAQHKLGFAKLLHSFFRTKKSTL